jgi:signal transduction histidine kinase
VFEWASRGAAPTPVRWTLRRKGIVALAGVVAYVATMAALISHQRISLRSIVQQLEDVHLVADALTKTKTSLAHGILVVNEAYFVGGPLARDPVLLDIEAIQSGLAGLRPAFPALGETSARLGASAAELRARADRTVLLDLRATFHGLVADLEAIERRVNARKEALTGEYRSAYDRVTWIGTAMGLGGIVLLGAAVAVFFSRLARDLRALTARASDIVHGYRGDALPVRRNDEVGELAAAINRMQSGLREREQQLEIARQQRFHHEKMAAVGSLAAAVAHEINNPIAAIHGVAEAMNARCSEAQCAQFNHRCEPGLILQHTQRIAAITRQLARITGPQSAQPELLDLNTLARNTCSLLSYDKRFSGVALRLDLDTQAAAVTAVPDHLTQVLINLLINAADALADVRDRAREIVVATEGRDDEVLLRVTDNGCGMTREVQARAFDEAFTTKGPGRGSGIGLFMCKSLIAAGGGSIDLASAPGVGTTVTVRLPVAVAPAAVH